MDHLEEIKLSLLAYFRKSSEKSLSMVNKLIKGEDFSLDEVDDLIDVLGKYQAFVICLRSHAKT